MANQATTWAWECSQSGGLDLLVLLSLANRYNLEKRGCWPSYNTLARDCKVSESAAKRSVRNLTKLGEVDNQNRKLDTAVNDSNFYSLPKFEQWLKALRQNPGGSNRPDPVGSNRTPGGVPQTTEPVSEPVKTLKANTRHVRVALPDWLPEKDWKDFCEMRQRIRAPLTEAGKEKIIKKLEAMRARGHDPLEVLSRSVENSWRGVFERDEKPQENLVEERKRLEKKYGIG